MFSRVLRDLARPALPALIDTLKRSQGLSVGELAEVLGMSYMGVKQYCVDLHKRGYLDTWRRPQANGRPELAYRLTAKAQALFPQSATGMTLDLLEAVHQLHGATAVEKVLFHYFNRQTEALAQRLPDGPPLAKLEALAKLRDAEGRFVQLTHTPEVGLALIEYHQPHAALAERYPVVLKLEEALLSRVLNTPVTRETHVASGLTMTVFRLPDLAEVVPATPFPLVKAKKPVLRKRATRRTSRKNVETPETTAAAAMEQAPSSQSAETSPEINPARNAPVIDPDVIPSAADLGDMTIPATIPGDEDFASPSPLAVEPTRGSAPKTPVLTPTRSHGFQQSEMELLLNV